MQPIAAGSVAPRLPDVDLDAGPWAILFYKVTCPVCQLAAPPLGEFERAYPGRLRAIGQDPPAKLAAFGDRFGWPFLSVPDLPPYPASSAYGIRVVPTLVLVGSDRMVVDVAESWDREAYNRISKRLADLTGSPFVPVSRQGDGLPPFRPG